MRYKRIFQGIRVTNADELRDNNFLQCGEIGKIKKPQSSKINCLGLFVVRMKGLEPPRLTAPDPKSGAAANYATSAAFVNWRCKCNLIFIIVLFFGLWIQIYSVFT